MSKLRINVRERKDRPGKWIVVVKRGTERHPRTFDTYEEASRFARDVQRAEQRGELEAAQKPKPRTLTEVCEAFLADKASAELAPDTLTTYRYLLAQTAIPRLGPERLITEVTEQDIKAYLKARKEQDGKRPRTIRSEWDRLRALWAYAVAERLTRRNVVAAVPAPKVPKKVYEWLRSPEIGPFLNACTGDFAPIATCTIFTGLRRREIIFLQRGDVDLHNNVIQVRSKPHLGFRPKNGRERSVPLDPTLRPFLERHLELNVGPGLDAWVFPQRGGARRSASTRWFAVSTQETATRAGISRKLTFHDLRRTYGAMLIEAGVDIYTVSRLLGHSDVKITQDVYAPICGRFLAQEAAKLGHYLTPSLRTELPRLPTLLKP